MLVSDFTVCIYTLQLQGLLELEVPLLSQVELSAGGESRGEKMSLRGGGEEGGRQTWECNSQGEYLKYDYSPLVIIKQG